MSNHKQILLVGDIAVATHDTDKISADKTDFVVYIKSAGASVGVIAKSEEHAATLAQKIAQALLDHAELTA